MFRRILSVLLFLIALCIFSFGASLGCSNSEEFGTPLYVNYPQDPNAAPGRFVMGISIQPGGVNIAVGGMQQFRSYATYNDGDTVEVTGEVEWFCENPAVGGFEAAKGRFLADKPGVAIVRCRIPQGEGYVISTASFVNSFNPNQDIPPAVPLNPLVQATDEGVLVRWDLNMTDGDLAGYDIWRTQVSAAHYASDYGRLNDKVWLYPPYLDKTVVSGWYYYRVTAEDLLGLNSAPSEEVAVFVTGYSHYGGSYDGVRSEREENNFKDAFSTAL